MDEAAYSAQLGEHNALWKAWTDASDSLFRAKTMGAFGGPALIAIRERALADAKQRLEEWEAANNWNPSWRSVSKRMMKQPQRG